MKKNKLLFVIKSLGIGGVEDELVKIANNINPSEFELKIIVCKKSKDLRFKVKNKKVVTFCRQKGIDSFFAELVFVKKISDNLKPDLVVSFGIYASLLCLLAKITRSIEARVCVFVGGVLSDTLSYYPFSLIRRPLCEWLYPNANYFIASSKAVAQDLSDSFKIKADKIKIVSSSINSKELATFVQKRKNRLSKGATKRAKIVFIGRLVSIKKADLAIDALALLRERSTHYYLYTVGNGPSLPELRKKVHSYKIQDSVKFITNTNNPWKHLVDADILVLPSDSEGSPKILLEAMYMGVPIVTTDWPGVEEIIKHNKNGIIVRRGSSGRIARGIEQIIENPRLREKLTRNSQSGVDKYDIGRNIKTYQGIFKRLAKSF